METESHSHPRHIEDVETLVRLADLRDLVVWRVAGERREHDSDPGDETDDVDGKGGSAPLVVYTRGDKTHLEVRCVMEVQTKEARLLADVASRYEFAQPLNVEPEVIQEFVQRVAIMAAYPFVRETLHQTAARMRVPTPVLGLLKAEQIKLEQVIAPGGPLDMPTLS